MITKSCTICYIDIDANSFVKLECQHEFCSTCTLKYLDLQINSGIDAKFRDVKW